MQPSRRLALRALIFAAGSQPAADVALRLVLLQQRLDLKPERAVIQGQPFTDVLVDGGFADAELFGGGADSRPVLNEVKSQLLGSLFQIFFDSAPLPCSYCAIYMERGRGL